MLFGPGKYPCGFTRFFIANFQEQYEIFLNHKLLDLKKT
jgi:hypothetical protein